MSIDPVVTYQGRTSTTTCSDARIKGKEANILSGCVEGDTTFSAQELGIGVPRDQIMAWRVCMPA